MSVTTPTEITPQMIQAGCDVLEQSSRLIDGYQWTDRGLVEQVLRVALAHRRSENRRMVEEKDRGILGTCCMEMRADFLGRLG